MATGAIGNWNLRVKTHSSHVYVYKETRPNVCTRIEIIFAAPYVLIVNINASITRLLRLKASLRFCRVIRVETLSTSM